MSAGYVTLEIPRLGAGPEPSVDVATSVLSCREELAKALDGYRFGRRAVISPEDLRIDPEEVEIDSEGHGMLVVKFRESEFLACRYETATVPHEARLRFFLDAQTVRLKVLGSEGEGRMDGF